MQNDNRLISDFVKMINAAAGTFAGMSREAGDSAREKMREAFGGFDFVSREEFDAVKAMAARAREDAESLKARVAALEAGGKAAAAPKPAAAPKAAAPKAATTVKPAAKPAATPKPAAKPAAKKPAAKPRKS